MGLPQNIRVHEPMHPVITEIPEEQVQNDAQRYRNLLQNLRLRITRKKSIVQTDDKRDDQEDMKELRGKVFRSHFAICDWPC